MNLNVLIACEESQVICKAFRDLGFNAFSCDLVECSGGLPQFHIIEDCLNVIPGGTFKTQANETVTIEKWNLLIAHPPCTYLSCVSIGCLKQDPSRYEKMKKAVSFFHKLLNANIEFICVENPKPMRICGLPRPNDRINPYWFGDSFSKSTWLWLKNLPPLIPTMFVKKQSVKSWHEVVSTSQKRSKSFQGIAKAMAAQYSQSIISQWKNAVR